MTDAQKEQKVQERLGTAQSKADPFLVAEEMLSPLTKVAALIAGFCGAAYLYGWRYLSQYYAEINAGWVMSLYEPVAVMQHAMPAMSTVLGLTVLMLWAFYSGAVSTKGLRRLVIGFLVAAVSLMVAMMVAPDRFKEAINAFLNIALLFGVAMVIARSITSVAEGFSSLNDEKTYLYASLFMGTVLGQATFVAGEAAKIDFDPRRSDLAHVRLYDSPAVDWRLVRALSDGSMLIAALEPGGVAMNVVPSDKVAGIRSDQHIRKLISPATTDATTSR